MQQQEQQQHKPQRQLRRPENSSRFSSSSSSSSDSYRKYICKSNKDAESASWRFFGRACEHTIYQKMYVVEQKMIRKWTAQRPTANGPSGPTSPTISSSRATNPTSSSWRSSTCCSKQQMYATDAHVWMFDMHVLMFHFFCRKRKI